ncbi:MAG: SemiSWEET transporter [Nitrospinae bacterium]|nr:SemiSWEET transporter [Nitrospinota bacterium]
MTDHADTLGYIAGALCTLAFIPQVYRTWKLRSAKEISLGMYSLLVTGVLLWLIYGIVLGAAPIIIANTVTLALALVILGMKIRFG